MRASGWALPIVAIIVWIACIGYPVIGLVSEIAHLTRTDVEIRSTTSLLVTSIGWAALIAIASMLVGWAPGRVLGKALAARGNARFMVVAALVLVPICLPSYVVFYAWWQSWPAESALHEWVVRHQWMQLARQATLFVGLVCWSWPLVSLCVAGTSASRPAQRDELLMLDGAGRVRRLFDRLHTDLRGLAIGGLLVFLATLANTTCFDLAEVFTFANELRAIQALGANARDVLIVAGPMMAVSAIGAAIVWALLARPPRDAASRVRRASMLNVVAALVIWIVAVVVPFGLFARNLFGIENATAVIGDFLRLYRWSVANTLIYAAISGVIGAAVAVGLFAMWQDHRKMVRWLANALAISWFIVAVMPGTIIGVALIAAYNQLTLSDLVLNTPVILVLAHLASFGFVAALMARWMAAREPRQIADLRQLDGAQTLGSMLETSSPRVLAAATATFAVIFVLAVGEIPVTALVSPPHSPGAGPLALTLLNDMHYQRPQTVMIASLGMIALAVLAAFLVAFMSFMNSPQSRPGKKNAIVALGAVFASMVNFGCTPDDPNELVPLKPQMTFGVAGTGLGQFAYPRAIDIDPQRKFIYVVDKQARVQRLGFDGEPQVQWKMPEKENGKPTGVSIAPDGRVFVADTHYFRVIAYDPEGNELMRFGEMGRGPGQFIYTTDVAFGPEGRLYVAEYGGNDRVQVFDERGNYLFEFGSFGPEPGQLNRPQSLAFNADKTELFIADACNHRIAVHAPNGTFLRSFGAAGRNAGELTYPYGLMMLPDGSLLVTEFGNNRLQRFDKNGKSLGIFGGIGRGTGQLQYPWSLAGTGDRIFVLDSGNNRVQVIRQP